MVSPETIRAYPFFSGFSYNQIVELSMAAIELEVEPGYTFIREDQEIHHFYLVVEGKVSICVSIPHRDVVHTFQQQILRELITEDVVISTLGRGEWFGWSAIIPPQVSTASVKAVTPCRVIEFDFQALEARFGDNCGLGQLLTLRAAQIVRQRLRDLRIELVASNSEKIEA